MIDVAIVGAGASGLAAAGCAARGGASVSVFDGNEKAGKKLYITGKGRCNVTNDCEPREFLSNVVGGKKFLQSCIYRFPPAYTKELLTGLGLKLKTERGNRVFPSSDKSSDVIKTLVAFAERGGAKLRLNSRVARIEKRPDGFLLILEGGERVEAKRLVLACGGKSYSSTGSRGDGFKFAASLGHTIIDPVPALVPIRLGQSVKAIEGLSLKNVSATVCGDGFSESAFGELLFTSDGASGPIILSMSSLVNRKKLDGAKLIIDLKPALGEDKLNMRILSDFEKYANKQLKIALFDLLPRSLVPYIIGYCALDADKVVNAVTKSERAKLRSAIKALTFDITGLYDVEYGIVTAGGVSLKEIDPSTMESKIVSGLYVVGEMLDADAFTGGFNIQIALSTGFAAGEAIGGPNV